MASNGIFNLDQDLVNSNFLNGNGSVSVEIINDTNPTAVRKITTNEPLGQDEFVVDNLQAKAGTQISGITFLSGAGNITSFQASGDAYAEVAVFPDPTSSSFATALGPIADTKFSLPLDPDLSVAMLRWGADASASGSGSIALGSGIGSIDFSAGGTGELFFAVLRQVPRTTPTDDALQDVVGSWRLPVHVRSADDLRPRTHLLSEVGGSLTTSVSATFGHEFNWMRSENLGKISGDIGLKLELDLKATFELQVQGKFAVVVSRESDDPVIRVRIFKLKLNGFDFALAASAAGTATVPLPSNFNDLLTATIGVHPLQILTALEDPTTIDTWIHDYGPQYVSDLLKQLTGFDLAAAIAKVNGLVSKWQNLPSSAASLFVKLARENVPGFDDIAAAAALLGNNDASGLSTFLQGKIQDLNVPFFSSPVGQYLESLSGQGALTLLQFIPADVQQDAKQVADFLSGDSIQTLLTQVITGIDKRLGIDAILQDIQDPGSLDKLLFDKLKAFLGESPTIQAIEKLQAAIKALMDKTGDLYNKTIKALENTYKVQLNAKYQQTTTDTALIDASFNFVKPEDLQPVQAALAQLLAGKLDDFLAGPISGVTLASGALTHQVKRHSHVDLTLPFLTIEQDWISNAVANFKAVDTANGRLTTYQLTATGDQIDKNTLTSLWSGRLWRSTAIALSSQIAGKLPPSAGLRQYAKSDTAKERLASATTSLRLEVSNMNLSQLQASIQPFATQFMRKAFSTNATFENWCNTGKLLPAPANTLVSLDVTLPASVPLAWLSNTVTDEKNQIYRKLSVTLQFLLRRYVLEYHFRDISHYQDLDTSYALLLYAAIPLANGTLADGRDAAVLAGSYWDTTDVAAVKTMAGAARDSTLPQGLSGQLAQAQRRLKDAGKPDLAAFYNPDHVKDIYTRAIDGANLNKLQSSLSDEENALASAHAAALAAANFNALIAANKPVEALQALAEFGNQITSAFNKDLTNLFVDQDALRRLSALIFAQSATVFDPSVQSTSFDSSLNVTVLRDGVAMPSDFPDFTVKAEDTAISLNAASFAILS